jgi:hypothetical protein
MPSARAHRIRGDSPAPQSIEVVKAPAQKEAPFNSNPHAAFCVTQHHKVEQADCIVHATLDRFEANPGKPYLGEHLGHLTRI